MFKSKRLMIFCQQIACKTYKNIKHKYMQRGFARPPQLYWIDASLENTLVRKTAPHKDAKTDNLYFLHNSSSDVPSTKIQRYTPCERCCLTLPLSLCDHMPDPRHCHSPWPPRHGPPKSGLPDNMHVAPVRPPISMIDTRSPSTNTSALTEQLSRPSACTASRI